MIDVTEEDILAKMRTIADRNAEWLTQEGRDELRDANKKCLDDIAFAIGKATRKDEESPIVRATPAPRVDPRRLRGRVFN